MRRWILPIAGDFDEALREAEVSLEELRGQDDPVFTGLAAFTAGSLEMGLGRYDTRRGMRRLYSPDAPYWTSFR